MGRVADKFRLQIEVGAIPVGGRLPSIRVAAEELQVSKNTVVVAYERLVSEGLVSPRHGSGFTVTDHNRNGQSKRPEHVSEAVDIISLLSAQLERSYSIRSGDGRPPTNWTEHSEIKRYLGLPARLGSDEGYGAAIGSRKLRELLSVGFSDLSINVEPDQILLTSGANHALDLIIRHFLSPGDTVLVDDPGYYPLFAKLKLGQVVSVGVKRTARGPCLEDFEEKVVRFKPKLFFTQSYAQNPTGSSIDLPTAHSILSVAERYGVTIVENDPFKDLMGPGDVLLSSIDQFQNVVFVGTFSKTLSANLRTGYIAARKDMVAELADLKMITIVNSSGYVERIVSNVIGNGHYRRHIKRLRNRIEKASRHCVENLSDIGLECFSELNFGYYAYPILPPGTDDIELARAAASEGIFIAPGSLFCVECDGALPGLRLNVGRAEDPRLFDFLAKAIGR